MICPNCGRRNPAGATFCSRCRQRLPLANRYSGQRRAVLAEPSGGGGGGALVLAVALLAGILFIGGGAAVYLSQPQEPPGTAVAVPPSAGRSLDVFVQETPTPEPTLVPLPTIDPFATPTIDPFATPTIDPFATPTIDPFATPTIDPFGTPTPTFVVITPAPTVDPAPTPTDARAGTEARFSWAQRGGTLRIIFDNNSTGATSWSWDFGDGSSSTEENPRHDYAASGQYRVVLSASGPNGNDSRARNVTVAPTATPTPPPTATPTNNPSPTPTPTRVQVMCDFSQDYTASCTASEADGPYQWSVPSDNGSQTSGDNSASASFSFSPPADGAAFTVIVRVRAANGTRNSQSYNYPASETPEEPACGDPEQEPCPEA